MKATDVLRNEHEGILAMLAVVETAAMRLRQNKDIPPAMMTGAVGFFRNFADRCHHGKEEDGLFPQMVERGVAKEGGPIGAMLAEHEQGRAYIRGMSEAAERYSQGDSSAITPLVTNTLSYVTLLRAHINKENFVLFPMADKLLGEPEQSQLYAAFEHIEATRTGPGEHEQYHAMIAEYQKRVADWK
jgi:hemerythrin-like domain-containing protein